MEEKTKVIYADANRKPCGAEKAVFAEIRRYDANGRCIGAVYGRFVDRMPRKKKEKVGDKREGKPADH